MKHALRLAGLILLAVVAVGCGDDGDQSPPSATGSSEAADDSTMSAGPIDASVEEFCTAYAASSEIPADGTGADLRDFTSGLLDVGTPKNVTPQERLGFEVYLDYLSNVDADTPLDEVEAPDITDREVKHAQAFLAYASEACADQSRNSNGNPAGG